MDVQDSKTPATTPELDNHDSKAVAAVEVAKGTESSSASSSYIAPKRAAENGAFDATEDPRYYKPIPTYEGIHRWDPEFEWTEEEEKKVVRKVSGLLFSRYSSLT